MNIQAIARQVAGYTTAVLIGITCYWGFQVYDVAALARDTVHGVTHEAAVFVDRVTYHCVSSVTPVVR